MTEREIESGFELVLDNRKKILIFAVIIVVCGCFFVWGFMAGKRQGMQLSAIADTDSSTFSGMEGSLPPTEDAGESAAEVPSLEEDVQQDLDWYHSVNKKAGEPVEVQTPKPSSATKETTKKSSAGSSVGSAAVTYSVQVGAFKRRPEAEAHSLNVRSKGFDTRVEPPKSSGQLYLVKVGKFDTRAEAVAVQLRLRKNGFSCFVKTN
jgi:cell division protein FtsN